MGQVIGASIMRTQSDARLAGLAADGHALAFEAIVARYERELLRHCARIAPAQAEDAVQQTFLSAWTALQKGTTVRDLRGWLHRIAHHAALRTIPPAGLAVQLADGDGTCEALEAAVERRLALRGAFAAVADLPERQREALLRTAVDGESRESVAGQLGISTGAVRQLVHRARQTLRAAATAVVPAPLLVRLAGVDDGLAGGVGGLGAAGAGVAMKAGAVAAVVASMVVAPLTGHGGRADPAQAASPPGTRSQGTREAATADRSVPVAGIGVVRAEASGPGRSMVRHGLSGKRRSRPGHSGASAPSSAGKGATDPSNSGDTAQADDDPPPPETGEDLNADPGQIDPDVQEDPGDPSAEAPTPPDDSADSADDAPPTPEDDPPADDGQDQPGD